MVIKRGEIWWADLPEPEGSMPGFRHPIVVIQSDEFNRSNLTTVIGIVITSNMRLAAMPGNVELGARQSGLPRDSVVSMTQIVTANKSDLMELVGSLPEAKIEQIEAGLRLVLSL